MFRDSVCFVMSKLNIIEMQNNDGGEDHKKPSKKSTKSAADIYLGGTLEKIRTRSETVRKEMGYEGAG